MMIIVDDWLWWAHMKLVFVAGRIALVLGPVLLVSACAALASGALAGLNEGLGGAPQSNPYFHPENAAAAPVASNRTGVQSVGPISIEGCEGIAVVSYTSGNVARSGNGAHSYSMSLRNNSGMAKVVAVFIERQNVPDSAKIATLSIRVPSKQTKTFEVSRSDQPPKTVSITSCT